MINRHTPTPGGWTHEQFNTKVLRKPDGTHGAIAREFGFNEYSKNAEVDFPPACRYREDTRDYWVRVRMHWTGCLAQPPGLRLKAEMDGVSIIIPLFTQTAGVQEGGG